MHLTTFLLVRTAPKGGLNASLLVALQQQNAYLKIFLPQTLGAMQQSFQSLQLYLLL